MRMPLARMFRPWFAAFFAFGLLISPAPFARAAAPEAPPAEAAKDKSKTEFVRFVPDGKGGGRLEAAIATYRNADGVTVHLVSALHIGEPSYYRGLSKTFQGYDALLYEMVKPKGMAIPAPGEGPRGGGGVITMFQRFLKDRLKLEFQLDAIDYTAENFVHADLDAETFFKMQEERGESMFTLMLRSMLHEMGRQSRGDGAPPITVFDLLAAMTSPDSARQYKLLLAKQLQNVEAQLAGIEGLNGSVIISERNKAALKVLEETIEKGETNIGIFYGAGHMSGIEKVLVGEMGFKPVGVEWRLAWDMETRAAGQPAAREAPVPKPE